MVPRESTYTILDLLPDQSLDAYFSSVPAAQQSVIPNGFTDALDPAAIQDGAVNSNIQSPDFATGVSGWIINVDGSVEFNDGTFRGALTAATIDIGGSDATSFHVDANGNLWIGAALIGSAPATIENDGHATFSDVTITGGEVATLVMDKGIMSWTSNIVFSSDSDTLVSWAACSLKMQDGTVYSIAGGDTGTMEALTFIYLDIAVSTTVLQKTTTYSTAVGDGKIMLAVAQNATNGAAVIPKGSADLIINGGAQITALSIVAGNIAASTITSDKLSVSQIAAISADLGAITAGTVTLNGAGYVRGGQTDFNTGVGFFLGYSAGNYKFSVGDPAADYFTFDGSHLRLKGSFELATNSVFNNVSYTVANLPIPATTVGFNSPSANE